MAMTPEENKKFTEGLFQQMQLTTDYLKELTNCFAGIQGKTASEESIFGLFGRAVCLLKTLSKCNEASDFQSVQHINRALIEIAVDLVMLENDKSGEIDKKLRAWEESAKLKSAEATIAYYERTNIELPHINRHQAEFIKRYKSSIESQRLALWNQAKHPDRWSGHGRSLLQDVQDADKIEPANLEKIYEVEYRRMNWFTHGSGLTGMRTLSAENFLNSCGLGYASSQKLAMLSGKIALKAFGFFKGDIYRPRWEQINRNIGMHIQRFLPESSPENAA